MELYNEDCFNILPKIPDNSVDMVLVDLPYGQIQCKWDTCIDLEKMWEQLKRIGKDKTAFVFFTTTKYGYKLIQSNEKWFRYDLVWEKCNPVGFLSAKKMPLRNHEMIYVFYKKLPTYNPQMTIGTPYSKKSKEEEAELYGGMKRKEGISNGERYPKSVHKFVKPNKKSMHPAQKPVEACEWLIKTYSNEGEKVLDFTMGSGSTGVGCKNTNRLFIGIEKDPEIFKIANKRLSSLDPTV